MNRLFYPALFHKAEEGGFWISFPDIPECLTQGDDMAQAYEMAVDALGLALVCREKEGQPIPAASNPAAIVPEPGSFLAVIEFDMLAYKKAYQFKSGKEDLEHTGMAERSRDVHGSELLSGATGSASCENTAIEPVPRPPSGGLPSGSYALPPFPRFPMPGIRP